MEASKDLSGPIQRIPAGLLGFFQLKSPSGRNPTVMPDVLQPSLEMFPWYMETLGEQVNVNAAIALTTAPGGVTSMFSPNALQVPEREWWWVTDFNVTCGAIAGETVGGLNPVIKYNSSGTIRWGLCDTPPLPTVAGLYSHWKSWRGFWVPPGSELGFTVGTLVTAGSVTFSGNLRRTVLPI